MKMRKPFLLYAAMLCYAVNLSAQTDTNIVVPTLQKALIAGLQNSYDIKISQHTLEMSRGEEQSYKGAFDPILGLGLTPSWGIPSDISAKDATNANLYLRVPTKLGLCFTAGVDYFRQRDSPDNGWSSTQVGNAAWLQLDIPLLKGIGKNNRSLLNYKISQLKLAEEQVDFDYGVTSFIKSVILAYAKMNYSYYLYESRFSILSDFEKYQANIKKKVVDEQTPAAEIITLNAELGQMRSDLNTAINDFKVAYIDLMKLLGQEISIASATTMTSFLIPDAAPPAPKKNIADDMNSIMASIDTIVDQSLAFRRQKFEEERSEKEVSAAKNEKLHDLNLQLKYSYASERFNDRWSDPWVSPQNAYPGANYVVTLSYQLPVKNSKAKGAYVTKNEAYRLEKERSAKVRFELKRDIENLTMTIINSVNVYNLQKDITDLRKTAYNNEVLKYNTGIANQLDVVNSHQAYLQSMLSVHEKSYNIICQLASLKFLCNQLPKTSAELSAFTIFDIYL